MFIKDLQSGNFRSYGLSSHDSLMISEDGRTLSYYNLQNGDGSRFGDYRFVNEKGHIPSKDEFFIEFGDGNYANIGGFTEDDKIVQQIRRILAEWVVSTHPELTKVEYFDKIVELMNEKGK